MIEISPIVTGVELSAVGSDPVVDVPDASEPTAASPRRSSGDRSGDSVVVARSPSSTPFALALTSTALLTPNHAVDLDVAAVLVRMHGRAWTLAVRRAVKTIVHSKYASFPWTHLEVLSVNRSCQMKET